MDAELRVLAPLRSVANRAERVLAVCLAGLMYVCFTLPLQGLYVAYRVIAFLYDRRKERKAGELLVVEWRHDDRGNHRVTHPYNSPTSRPRTAEEEMGSDWVLGYSGYALTAMPERPEDEWVAMRLARAGDDPGESERDREIWRFYELDDPRRRELYRHKIPLGNVLTHCRQCIYCAARLSRGQTEDLRQLDRSLVWRYEVAECPRCGWWCVSHSDEKRLFAFDLQDYVHAYAVMRRFDPFALDTPLSLARDFLIRHPNKSARFDPFRFEDLMADCLKDYLGDCDIVKLGGRNDRGVDIKAVHANGQTTLIQVKRRTDFTKREGVRAVRELHGVMLREGVARGMVITTASEFTRDAHNEANDARRNLAGYSMELLPFADVVALLGPETPKTAAPWRTHGIRLDLAEPGWSASEDWIDRAALPEALRGS